MKRVRQGMEIEKGQKEWGNKKLFKQVWKAKSLCKKCLENKNVKGSERVIEVRP